TLVFLVFFFFLDNNGILTTRSLRNNNNRLKKQKAELEESIRIDSLNYMKMNKDAAEIERFGRENFYMKRDNEEIFIVKRDK
ncbi:MAG: septum formation initiator family protein, partial [Bacteroidales bacterium]|nr:septum formation initiator family protein [Bacteroidales bacterium]